MSLLNPNRLSSLADYLPIKTLGSPDLNFNPANLPSPVWAFNAHEAVGQSLYQDSARTILATANNDVVGGFLPLTGFGSQAASQATTANKPLLKTGANGINGHNALLFDGSNDHLVLTGLTAASGDRTFYMVVNPVTATGTARRYLEATVGPLTLFQLGSVANKIAYADSIIDNIADATTGNQILTYTFGGGTGTIYRNNVSLGSGTFTNCAIGGTVMLGCAFNIAQFASTLFGAFYIYNALHTAVERNAMHAYLATQWGIS